MNGLIKTGQYHMHGGSSVSNICDSASVWNGYQDKSFPCRRAKFCLINLNRDP